MTDYKKNRRDDERPSSRPQSPNSRYGEQSSPGPARPRPNRESVDRAWESGAPNTHADYRPRSPRGNNPRPPRPSYGPSQNTSQGNWRNTQEHSSAPNGRRPFDNRQDRPRPERTPYTPNPNTPSSSAGPRPRPFNSDNSDRPRFDDRRNDRRSSSDRPYSNGPRPDFRSQPNNNQRPPYREHDRFQGEPPRNTDRDERQPREFNRDNRPPRSFDRQPREFNREQHPPRRDDRQPREFNRDNRPPRRDDQRPGAFNRDNRPPRGNERGFERDNRPPRYPQANTQNPRWQSRPGVQSEQQGQDEQFEGDYERFGGPQQRERPRPSSPYRHYQGKDKAIRREDQPTEEKQHVTRLPDGHVLKGPRPVQRRDAEFWTGVADETEQLVKPLRETASSAEETEEKQPTEESGEQEASQPEKKPFKQRTRVASSVARAKKPRTKKDGPKPPSKGPKPSQKGYKWPTP